MRPLGKSLRASPEEEKSVANDEVSEARKGGNGRSAEGASGKKKEGFQLRQR